MNTATGAPLPKPPARVLVVKLADLGDALLTTPTVHALRAAWPDARIDVLTTPQAAVVYEANPDVDRVHALDVHARGPAPVGAPVRGAVVAVAGSSPLARGARSSRPIPIARFAQLARIARRARTIAALRRERYDVIALCHSLVTRRGAMKYAALLALIGAPVRAGVAPAGRWRGAFLTHRGLDRGYGAAHVVETMAGVAAALGVPVADLAPRFGPGDAAHAAAAALLAGADVRDAGTPSTTTTLAGRTIAFHPGAGPYSAARRWAPERFAAVMAAVHDAGARTVLCGTAADDDALVRAAGAPIDVDATGRTDVPTLAALLARCDGVVCNDGGVMHLAAAVGTPVVAVFGPSNDAAWGPWPPARAGRPSPHRIVRVDVPCRPCLYVGHRLGSPAGCPTRDCLRWLGPAPVIAAVFDALAGSTKIDEPA
ncbi:MAG: glycosyltransferase family 9 protein [Ardenticatenales bacterium]